MNKSQQDIDRIPHGPYCYTYNNGQHTPCPFFTHKDINGVSVPFCEFLQKGGTPSPEEDDDSDYEKLIEHYGSIEKVWEGLPLDLLFDQVKECSEHDDYLNE